MKWYKIIAIFTLLFCSFVQAKCLFAIKSTIPAHRSINNGTFWAMNKVLNSKGYSKALKSKKADIFVELSLDLERSAKSNLMTGVKDFFDNDHEADYIMKYKYTTKVNVSSISGNQLSASLSKSGTTIRSFNEHDEEIASDSELNAAKILELLPSCDELKI